MSFAFDENGMPIDYACNCMMSRHFCMKKFYVFVCTVLISLCGIPVQGADYKSILIDLIDGSEVSLSLNREMTVQVTDGNLAITNLEVHFAMPVEDIRKWTFSTKPGTDDGCYTGISDVKTNTVLIAYNDDKVVFDNLPAGSAINLVSIHGRVLKTAKTSGHYEMSLTGLRGIYLLTYNNNSLKIAIGQ